MLCVCAVLFGIASSPTVAMLGNETNAAPVSAVRAEANATNLIPNASTNPSSTGNETLEPDTVEGDVGSYEEGTVLATLADGVTADEAIANLNTIAQLEGVSLEKSITDTVVKLSLPANVSVDQATALVQTSSAIKSASPNHYLYTQETPSASDNATNTLVLENANQSSQLIAGTALGDALGVQSVNVTANDPKFIDGTQWSLENANVTDAWEAVLSASSPNQSTTIAVVDAGFDVSHNDLKANIVAQYDATTMANSIAPDNPNKSQCDHGTHASGIIAADTNNALGVAGSTYNTCKILPIRVQDATGSIKTDYLVKAFDYICDNADRYNIRVVNMSLGSATYKTVTRDVFPQLYDAIEEAREHGIVTVVAACNSGTKGRIDGESTATKAYYPPFNAFPSDFDNVVSVINLREYTSSAVDNNVTRASDSNYNVEGQRAKNISAPGANIYGLFKSQGYGYKSGTSMAAPLVAGVLGLMFQVNPDLTREEATEILYSTAHDLTTGDHMGVGWDEGSGFGEVDAAKAVAAAMGTTHRIDISKLPITIPNESYIGEAVKPTVFVSGVGITLEEGVDYEVTAGGDCINAGTYSLTLTGIGTYTGTTHATFTIEKAPLAQANLALETTELNYNGSVQYAKDSLTAFDIGKNGNTKLVVGASGDITVVDPGVILGPGSVTITATSACKNFTGTATLDYTVNMKKAPVYALYNKKAKQWFYTTSDAERTAKLNAGWASKGKVWKTPSKSTKPVWRLYNKKTGAYRYTTDKSTRSKLVKAGWKNQGIAWYADDYYKTKPVYAQYKKATGTWRYAKKKSLSGFTNKGIAFYCL